jgi:gluconolactonase
MYGSAVSSNKLAVLACAVVCTVAGNAWLAFAADPPKASAMVRGPIVAPKAEIEKLFGDGFWTEGPAVAPDGKVYFCDITMTFATKMAAGNVWVFDPESGRTTLFRSPSGMAAGIKFDANGDMVMTQGADHGGRAVVRTDMKTGRSVFLAANYNGRPFNSPNDLDIDREGRIYFTDPRYFGD